MVAMVLIDYIALTVIVSVLRRVIFTQMIWLVNVIGKTSTESNNSTLFPRSRSKKKI